MSSSSKLEKNKAARKFLRQVKAKNPDLFYDLVQKAEWFLKKDKNEYRAKDLKTAFRAELNRDPALDPSENPDTYGIKLAIDAVADEKDDASDAKRLFGNTLDQVFKEATFHMSKDPLVAIDDKEQLEHSGHKPTGFWYSCEHEWLNWVRLEMPGWESEHYYDVKLDYSKILTLDTEEKMIAFDREYGIDDWTINWELVAEKYYGIEICPARRRLRFKLLWYSTWDIASGCIWNKKAILEFKPFKKPTTKTSLREEEWREQGGMLRMFQMGDSLPKDLSNTPANRKKPLKHKAKHKMAK